MTEFFRECSPLNMSSNNIRATMATHGKVLEKLKLITPDQRGSFCSLSGHSVATSDKDYVKFNSKEVRIHDMQVATRSLEAGRSYFNNNTNSFNSSSKSYGVQENQNSVYSEGNKFYLIYNLSLVFIFENIHFL